jgi:hypothetical protein
MNSPGSERPKATGVGSAFGGKNIRIVLMDRDHCIATWNQTVIEIWRGVATVTGVIHMIKTCEKLLENGKGNVTYLAILERSAPPPSEQVRTILAQWSREVVPRMAGAVLVTEGTGFRAALVRGVGIALTALLPHRVPFKFAGTVDEALTLLAPLMPASVGGSNGLRLAVEEVQAQMGRHGEPDR